jgi:hypothetical protein
MFTRFSNPHAHHTNERTVTRHEILEDDNPDDLGDRAEDAERLKELDRFIMQSIGAEVGISTQISSNDSRERKRRKTKHSEDEPVRDVVREYPQVHASGCGGLIGGSVQAAFNIYASYTFKSRA